MTSCLLSCTSIPFLKGVNSTMKEFAPKWSKFFPFRVDPFQKGTNTILTEFSVLKVYPFPLSQKQIVNVQIN